MKRDHRLVGLSREHHHALALAATLRKGILAGTAAAALAHEVATRFTREIEPHFEVEEALLLPALRALGGADRQLARQGEADHAWLRQAAARIASGKTGLLQEFGERLSDHVRFEERILFQRAQIALAGNALERIHRARPS